jgi:hypothetical protein
MFSQKIQYDQKVEECESLRTELLRRFMSTPYESSTSQSSPFPPSSSVGPPSSFQSKIASRLGFTRSGPQGVSSPLTSTPGNAGIGAGGRPPSPTGSSVHSEVRSAYPYKAKALYRCACQNSLASAFDPTIYYRYRVPG